MTTPTHYRFEFDEFGRVRLSGPYNEGDLGPHEHRMVAPEFPAATRGVIVPRSINPVRAESIARILVEKSGGYGA